MAKTPRKRLRMAFIGTGEIANIHLTELQKLPEIEVVALCDIKQDILNKRGEAFGIDKEHRFLDYRAMLKSVKPDAVNVCTPNGVHAAASIAASRAGAHVIVEKPMAMNAKECRQMLAAAEKAGKKLVVGFQYRYDPRTQFLKKQADKGVFGDILFGRVQALRRRGIPNWGVFGQKALQGGGPMIDIGVHVLEMTHYVMGSPKPIAACGMTRTYLGDKKAATQVACQWPNWDYKRYTVEDLAVGHIRFENGAVIHLEASFAAHIEKDTWDFQLMGTKGGCQWEKASVFTDLNGYQTDLSPGYLPEMNMFSEGFEVKLKNFAGHCLNDTPSETPGIHGLMVQQMLDGVYRSAEQGGREVAIR